MSDTTKSRGDQFPKREGREARLEGDNAHLVQKDIDKLFHAIAWFMKKHYDITLNSLTVDGNITVTGTVDGVDVSALKPHALDSTTYHSSTLDEDDIMAADANGLPKALVAATPGSLLAAAGGAPPAKFTREVTGSAGQILQIGTSLGALPAFDFIPLFMQAAAPTDSDIPDGAFAFWDDNALGGGNLRLCYNQSGTVKTGLIALETTTVATPGVDTQLPTEKAVRDAIVAVGMYFPAGWS